MLTLGERIRYVRDTILKVNQATFADRLGFSRVATISDYEKDKRIPDIATLRKIATLGSVTLEWLLTGKGPIFIYETYGPEESKDSSIGLYSEDFVEVKVYDMATAGDPKTFPSGEPIDVIMVPRSDYRRGPVAIRVEGDGMSPTILNGAVVGINRKDRRLISGRIYAVWLSYEGITIKRIFIYPEKIVLKPDNHTFPETIIPKDRRGEEFLIGRVVWVFQRY